MERGKFLTISLLAIFALNLSLVSADCDLGITLLKQDPYPAVPGEYTDLVFQVSGVSGTDCKDITFELLEEYPIEFDPGTSGVKIFKRVNYLTDFDSNILIPYKVRINEDAIDGANEIKVTAQNRGEVAFRKSFNLEIEDFVVDF